MELILSLGVRTVLEPDELEELSSRESLVDHVFRTRKGFEVVVSISETKTLIALTSECTN